MTTGTSSGNSSRTERSEEQIEDSVEVGYEESMATEDFRKHTPTEVWLVTEYCKPRRAQETHAKRIWLVTKCCQGSEKYWGKAKRKCPPFACQFSELLIFVTCSF